ncbi:putative reverse transcriptase domain-containing protein [Tanacetum coccineum]|uniref:Reverse transcriptase domain-containing protein n=1 Tax=Tanacetum coccineum TaxID=301880 RepID=A0ABQ5J863_9ASTR
MWPCKVEEKITLKEVDGKMVKEIETKIIAKDCIVTKIPRQFQGYETSEEEPVEQPRRHDLYGFVDHPQLQQGNPMNEFALHRLPQPEGNMNGWLMEDEEELERNEVDSDLESTASSKPLWKKTTKDDPDYASRNYPKWLHHVEAVTTTTTTRTPTLLLLSRSNCKPFFQQLQAIITQVANNANNANNGNNGGGNGNDGNNGCSYKTFQSCNPKEYDGKGGAITLTRWIEKMENVIDNSGCDENQKVKYAASSLVNKGFDLVEYPSSSKRFHELAKLVPHLVTPESSSIKRYIVGLAPEIRGMLRATQPTTIHVILRAGILTDEAVSCSTLTKGNDKRKVVEESSKSGRSWKDNKKEKVGTGFVVTTSPRNEFVSSNPKCSKQVALVNAVRMGNNPRVCYECGSPDHFRNTCPKMNRAPSQAGNQLAFEANRNNRSNGNQVRGIAFNVNVNAMEVVQDPNIVTGTFSLKDHFVTVLFDFGADFSFISTKFAPLLNVKPSIANHGYVIEVADGKKVEVDSIFRDCKLELGSSLFSINLIPLGHGSFNVIVGMDWLSQHKAVIVCHEKVVEIPVEDGMTLRVHGERTVGIAKALKSVKEDEPKLGDISIARDFEDVFLEDLAGLPLQ